jgi:hypothetical protein
MRIATALTLILAGAGSIGAPMLAQADNDALQCTGAEQSSWMSRQAVSDSLLAQGYAEVRKIKVSDGHCYEAYVVAANGDKKELYIDPVSGQVVAED